MPAPSLPEGRRPSQELEDPEIVRKKSSHHELSGSSNLGQIYSSVLLIFFPTLVSRLAWIGMKTTDTALLGHTGTDFLAASSLSDFWTSMSGALMYDVVLGTFCGQAFGAAKRTGEYDNVGIWLQVSFTVFGWVIIPVFVLQCATSPVLQHGFGTEESIAGYAGYYAIVLALCLPAKLVSGKLGTFFAAQAITSPSSRTTPIALTLNLIFGLQFVLGIPFPGIKYGFWACPIVTTCVEWFLLGMYLFVYCGYFKYHEKCWTPKIKQWNWMRDIYLAPLLSSGDSKKFEYFNANIRPRMKEFIDLAVPGTLSLASDFWRMSLIGLLAGTLGTDQVAVFNSSYRFAWMNTVVVGSFSSACVTQLSIALGTGDGHLSQKIRDIGIWTVFTFLFITTGTTVLFVEQLGKIFSSDPDVLEKFADCRFEMGFMIFFMCFAMHFEAILTALKLTKLQFKASLAGSWLGQVPATVLLLQFHGNNLKSVYLGVGIGYCLLFVLYAYPAMTSDLHRAAEEAHEKNKSDKGKALLG